MGEDQAKVLVVSEDEMFRKALGRALDGEYETDSTSNLPDSDPGMDLIVWHLGPSSTPTETSIGAFACPTLVLGPAEPETMISAVEAQAIGFLGEDAPLDEIVESIAVVLRGGAVVPPALLGTLLRHLVQRRRDSIDPKTLETLTPRELEVFRLAATGAGRKQIAARLFISTDTVRTHLQRVYRKLGVHSQSELMAIAARTAHIEISEDP